jgi:hypothetical protein
MSAARDDCGGATSGRHTTEGSFLKRVVEVAAGIDMYDKSGSVGMKFV